MQCFRAIIRDPQNIRATEFDPYSVVLSHGVDTQKLSFQLAPSTGSEPLAIRLVHADYGRIGYAHLTNIQIGAKPYLQLSGIDLRPDFIGKGLGTLLYLSAGAQAKRMGLPMVSSPNTFNPSVPLWLSRGKSPQAESAWVNLVRTGYAKELRIQENSNTHIYYIMDPIAVGTLLEKTETFFETKQRN